MGQALASSLRVHVQATFSPTIGRPHSQTEFAQIARTDSDTDGPLCVRICLCKAKSKRVVIREAELFLVSR